MHNRLKNGRCSALVEFFNTPWWYSIIGGGAVNVDSEESCGGDFVTFAPVEKDNQQNVKLPIGII